MSGLTLFGVGVGRSVFVILLFASTVFAGEKSTLTLSQALEDTAHLCTQIETQYVYLRHKEAFYSFNWNDRCEAFRNRLRQHAPGDEVSLGQFSIFLTDFLRVHQDAHTGMRTTLASESGVELGVSIRYVPEGFWLRSGNLEIEKQTQIAAADLASEKLIVESIQGEIGRAHV
jgi:hypothetical protein